MAHFPVRSGQRRLEAWVRRCGPERGCSPPEERIKLSLRRANTLTYTQTIIIYIFITFRGFLKFSDFFDFLAPHIAPLGTPARRNASTGGWGGAPPPQTPPRAHKIEFAPRKHSYIHTNYHYIRFHNISRLFKTFNAFS